jgi:hypothetical protein
MSKVVVAARQALVHKCLELGVEDHAEIKKIAAEVVKSCGRQQVAGVKARKNFQW